MNSFYSCMFGILFGSLAMSIFHANKTSQEKLSICSRVVNECEDYINAGVECDFKTIKWCIKP